MTTEEVLTDRPDLLTTEEVAEWLRTSAATIRYWRHLNQGPPGFKVGRRVLYRREDVETWISQQQEADGSD